MKKKKWLAVIICVLVMCLAFTGCASLGRAIGKRLKAMGGKENSEEVMEASEKFSETAFDEGDDEDSQPPSEEEEMPADDSDDSFRFGYEEIYVLTCITSHYDDGSISEYTKFDYDLEGNRILAHGLDADGNSRAETCWYYDGDLLVEEEEWLWNGDLYYRISYSYDELSRLVEETMTDGDGNSYLYAQYVYDDEGKLIEELDYDEYGERGNKIYNYDEDGNLIFTRYCNVEAQSLETTYDKKGNIIKEVFNNEGDMDSTEYKYDDFGNQIERANYNGDGSLYSKAEYQYDQHGNATACFYYDETGSLVSADYTEYEYDANGNKTAEYYYYENHEPTGCYDSYEYEKREVFCVHIPESMKRNAAFTSGYKSYYEDDMYNSVELRPIGDGYYRVEINLYRLYGLEGIAGETDSGLKMTLYHPANGGKNLEEAEYYMESDGSWTLEFISSTIEYLDSGTRYVNFQ